MATPETILNLSWYAGSGAKNHVIATIDNTTMKTKYRGQEKLIVRNGKQLSISHIGQAYLPTHFPQITKNLVNISQLTVDNRVFVEFYANCCLVKEKT